MEETELSSYKLIEIIKFYLKNNGKSSRQQLFKFIKKHKPEVNIATVTSTLTSNRDILSHPSRGIWDLKKNSYSETKDKLIYELMKLNYHYENIIQKHNNKYNINDKEESKHILIHDIRISQVNINGEYNKIMKKIWRKYRKILNR